MVKKRSFHTFKRIVKISKSHSFFLFGARATGKSTLLEQEFAEEETLWINLLDPEIDDELYKNPRALKGMIEAQPQVKWLIIDEIQKNPKLLDVVHELSKNKRLKFALTGSSARKLKRGGANLLAGRAFNYFCYPLSFLELGDSFELNEVLHFGSLPETFSLTIDDKKDYLRAYVDNYFKEEIVAEQIVRKLKPFKNFLSVAAQMNGQILNINKIAHDVGVDHTTIQNYFEVLEETLVGFLLEPYHRSVRKRQRSASKFYFFDVGVTRALKKSLENQLQQGTSDYGDCFEHFLILEIMKLAAYRKPDWRFSYLATKDNAEVDLIIDRPGQKTLAIEIKSTTRISSLQKSKLNTLVQLTKDLKDTDSYLFSQDSTQTKIDHLNCMPWQDGLKAIGLCD